MAEDKNTDKKEECCSQEGCCSGGSGFCSSGRGKFLCGIFFGILLILAGFGLYQVGKCSSKHGGCSMAHHQAP